MDAGVPLGRTAGFDAAVGLTARVLAAVDIVAVAAAVALTGVHALFERKVAVLSTEAAGIGGASRDALRVVSVRIRLSCQRTVIGSLKMGRGRM